MNVKINNTTKGILLVLSTAIISGVSIFANSYFVTKIDPNSLTLFKNSLTAFALFSIIIIGARYSKNKNFNQLKKLNKNEWGALTVIGLIGGSIPFLLFFQGLAMIQGSAGALIHKSMFIFVAIFATFFLKEKINKLFFPLALMLLVGNFLLLNGSFGSIGTGHLMVLAATLLWAAENTYSKHLLKNINGTSLAFGRMFFGSIFILGYIAATTNFSQIFTLSGSQLIQIGIATLFLIGYVLTWYNGLKFIPVSLATSILLIGAPITSALNWIFLNKELTVYQISGAFIILAGMTTWITLEIIKSNKKVTILNSLKAKLLPRTRNES